MPVELIELERGQKVLSPGDRGFLITLAKTRWNRQVANDALKLLKSFAKEYCEEKNREADTAAPGEDGKDSETADTTSSDDNKKLQKQNSSETGSSSDIQFVQREMMFTDCCFIATNLADPTDYACYIMNQLTDVNKYTKTKFPLRIMPVLAVCDARAKAVEKAAYPFLEATLGAGEEPYRFSLMYRGHKDADSLTQHDAKNIIRNCVWAVNPNCIQCIKYQDYAVLVDILAPLFVFGLAKDFQRLGGYNTWTIRNGYDFTDQGEDSEDDISDDPTLDEEDEKRRKLRIKRKRRAEKAGTEHQDDDEKRYPDLEPDEDMHGEEEDTHGEEGHKEDFEMQEENGIEDEGGEALEENGI